MIKLILNNPKNCASPCEPVIFPKSTFWGKLFGGRNNESSIKLATSIEQLRQSAISDYRNKIVSANEVKLSDRMIYVRKGTFGNGEDLVLINPRVVESYGKVQTVEGGQFSYDLPTQTPDVSTSVCECFTRSVFRPYRIVVSYRTENGEEKKLDLEGRNAVIFLQRYHLLDGITPVDIDNHSGEIQGDDYVIESKDTQNALTAIFKIEDMGTGCCSNKLEPIIEKIPGVISCSVSPTLKTVSVRFFSPISYSGELEDVIKREAIYQEIVKGIDSFSDEGIKYTIKSVRFSESKNDRVGAVLSGSRITPRRPVVERTGRERRSGCPAHRGRMIDSDK